MSKTIVLNKSQVNEAFLHLYQAKYIPPKYSVYYGGSGSGKSFSALDSLVYRCLKYSTYDILIVRKIASTLQKTVISPLEKILNKRYRLVEGEDYTKKTKDLEYHFASGSIIRVTGYDDPEKLKGIEGVNVIVLEELTDFTEEDLDDIVDRMRSIPPKNHPWKDNKVIGMFNPIYETHWVRRRFFDEEVDTSEDVHWYFPNELYGEDLFILKTTWRDNKWYNGKYKDPEERRREKVTNPRKYSVYCNGNFGVLGKLVYTNVVFEDFTPEQAYAMRKTIPGYGIDFGFNDPSAFLEAVMDHKGDIWLTCETGGEELRTSQFASMIQEKQPDYPYLLIWADSSAKTTIEDMRNDHGFNGIRSCKKGPGSILAGIEWLQDRTIHVNRKLTPRTAGELESYQYEKDKRTGLYKPMPKDANNHFLDALRYLTEQWRKGEWVFS